MRALICAVTEFLERRTLLIDPGYETFYSPVTVNYEWHQEIIHPAGNSTRTETVTNQVGHFQWHWGSKLGGTLSNISVWNYSVNAGGNVPFTWHGQAGGYRVTESRTGVLIDTAVLIGNTVYDANQGISYGTVNVTSVAGRLPSGTFSVSQTGTFRDNSGTIFVRMTGSFGQASPTKTIRGKVVDAAGRPLHGVKITASNAGGSATAFTDYDSNATGLDASIDGDFEVSGVFDSSRPVTLQVHARAIGSATPFNTTVTIQPAQFTNGTANLTNAIRLTNFKLIDQSKIILLDDQKNDANDHVIRRRSAFVVDEYKVSQSSRYMESVKVVTKKLASLGFRQSAGTNNGENAPRLIETTRWADPFEAPPAAEGALLLFQTLWFNGGSSGVFKSAILNSNRAVVNGKVDAATLASLNAASGVIWAKNDLSAKATFSNAFQYQAGNRNRWMHASVIRLLKDLGVSNQLVSNSSAVGGRPNVPNGQSHWAGSEIDMKWMTANGVAGGAGDFFRPLRNPSGVVVTVAKGVAGEPLSKTPDGKQREWTDADRTGSLRTEAQAIAAGRTWRTAETYSRSQTRALLMKILARPVTQVNQVIFNDPAFHDAGSPLRINNSRFVKQSPHNDHIHVGVPFNKADKLSALASGAPAWPSTHN